MRLWGEKVEQSEIERICKENHCLYIDNGQYVCRHPQGSQCSYYQPRRIYDGGLCTHDNMVIYAFNLDNLRAKYLRWTERKNRIK